MALEDISCTSRLIGIFQIVAGFFPDERFQLLLDGPLVHQPLTLHTDRQRDRGSKIGEGVRGGTRGRLLALCSTIFYQNKASRANVMKAEWVLTSRSRTIVGMVCTSQGCCLHSFFGLFHLEEEKK